MEDDAGESIAALLERGKSSYIVRLTDGRCYGPFKESVLVECLVKRGRLWTQALEQELAYAQQLATAKESAVFYLSHASHTEAEVRRYLKVKKRIGSKEIHETVQWLRDSGWLDDEALGERIVQRFRENPGSESERSLKARLMRRGIDSNTVASVLAGETLDEYPGALKLGRKRLDLIDYKLSRSLEGDYGSRIPRDSERRRLLMAYLARKGYAQGTVMRVIQTLLDH